MYIFVFILSCISLLGISGCNYSTINENNKNVDSISPADTERIPSFSEETPTLITITNKYEDSLKQIYPFLTKKNCSLYPPELLLKKITKQCEKTDYSINDFTSEAGEDYFFVIYASLLKNYNDSLKQPQTETIRTSLNNIFLSVNGSFSCISEGGTMYYHNTNRIPGYIEWELTDGWKKKYKSSHNFSLNDIENEIIIKGLGYQKEKVKEYQKSKEDIGNCITLPLQIDSLENKNWIIEKTLNFISEQY